MKQYYVFAMTKDTSKMMTRLVTTSDYYEVERAVDNIIKKHGQIIYAVYPADMERYYDAQCKFLEYVERSMSL